MKLNKDSLRYISLGLLVLAVLEIFQDKLGLKIDTTTIVIVGLAILLYIIPELSNLSKFKYGDIELEFEKKVDELEKLVIAEEKVGGPVKESKEVSISWQHYYKEYNDILNSKSSNLEKVLRASQLIELMISVAGKDFGLVDNSKLKNPTIVMRELHKNKLISNDELDLYNEFYSFRNKIIHGEIKELSDALTTRILDLLWRIVRIFG
ncbi:MAG: hypothetical protein EOO61_01000 [Hymenobacter sp.]|jgi:uncharacterized protein YutE (UPF0331/DUF86 family)|nr:MAG: hypothetical protein EOO61_01000 [Hymenobacter sp.]